MILAANNYAYALVVTVKRFEEAKALMRKIMPVARRVLGNENILTLQSKMIYAEARARRRAPSHYAAHRLRADMVVDDAISDINRRVGVNHIIRTKFRNEGTKINA